jgi:hypothetical protein
MKTIITWTAILVTLAGTVATFAAPPKTINYQGYLNFKGAPANGPLSMTFSLYSSNPARNNPVWQETQPSVPVTNGIYNVQLGDKNPLRGPFDVPYYLGVQIEGDTEMSLQPLSSAPYALRAITADSVAANSVDSAAISGKINNSKLDLSTVVAKAGDTMTGTLHLPALQAINPADVGQAGLFQISNYASNSPALLATTDGTGAGVFGENTGSGNAGRFQIFNPDNGASALYAQTNGSGYAGEFIGPVRVIGPVLVTDPVSSTVPTGTAPFMVASTTQVNNLNANLLNGKLASEIISAAADEVRIPISSCGTTISTSGSYYVTQNLSSNGNCITVSASNVTIDLMGFTLAGNNTGFNSGISITEIQGGMSDVEIRNGTIKKFYDGIISPVLSLSLRVINIRAVQNRNSGINLNGDFNLVKNCTVWANGIFGIISGNKATIIENTINANNTNNISGGGGLFVYGSTMVGSSLIKDNILIGNLLNNIYVDGSQNVLESNLLNGSTNGIVFNSSGNFYANNRASGNTTNFNLNGTTQVDGGGNVGF